MRQEFRRCRRDGPHCDVALVAVTSMAVKLLNAKLVGETGIWKGCGHHADRFVIELSGFVNRLQSRFEGAIGYIPQA